MTIIEVLTEVGLEHVRVQPLINAISNVSAARKGGSNVTFYTQELTPADLVVGQPENTGLIVWIRTDILQRARVALEAKAREVSGG